MFRSLLIVVEDWLPNLSSTPLALRCTCSPSNEITVHLVPTISRAKFTVTGASRRGAEIVAGAVTVTGASVSAGVESFNVGKTLSLCICPQCLYGLEIG